MFRRVVVGIGRGFRETGQALERMGMRAQDNWIFQEKLCRHRAVMNLYDQRPKLGAAVFVAPNASVIGSVEVKESSSVWCAHSLRRARLPPCTQYLSNTVAPRKHAATPPAPCSGRYGAVVRGDQSSIYVGAFSSIGDRTVVQVRGCHRARCARTNFPTKPLM